jgi:hypothetical protein
MPYPNEHSCRLRQPGEFQPDSFRRIKNKDLVMIIGRLKGKDTTTTQAYRYPKADWTEAKAKAHCEDAGGSFEAASKDQAQANYFDPLNNPLIPQPEDIGLTDDYYKAKETEEKAEQEKILKGE